MAFLVSLYSRTNSLSVLSVGIGQDVTAPCITSLQLIANIISGEPTGHTFLWELFSGGSVTFITSVNQLIVDCTISTSSNRVFKFTVDANTSAEQIFYFRYNGAPTENLAPTYSNDAVFSGLGIDNGSPVCSSIRRIQAIFGTSTNGTAQQDPSNWYLSWALPINIIGLFSIHVEKNINGSWVNVANLLPTDTQSYSGITYNSYYRIKTIYFIDHQYYSEYSCVYISMPNIATNLFADELTSATYSNDMSPFTVVNFELILEQTIDSTSATYSNDMSPFTVVNFGLILEQTIDSTSATYSNDMSPFTVVYLSGTVIG